MSLSLALHRRLRLAQLSKRFSSILPLRIRRSPAFTFALLIAVLTILTLSTLLLILQAISSASTPTFPSSIPRTVFHPSDIPTNPLLPSTAVTLITAVHDHHSSSLLHRSLAHYTALRIPTLLVDVCTSPVRIPSHPNLTVHHLVPSSAAPSVALNLAAALAVTPWLLLVPLGVLPPSSLHPPKSAVCRPHISAAPVAMLIPRREFHHFAGLDERLPLFAAISRLTAHLHLHSHHHPCSASPLLQALSSPWPTLPHANLLYHSFRVAASPWNVSLSTTFTIRRSVLTLVSAPSPLPIRLDLAAVALRAHLHNLHFVPSELTLRLSIPVLKTLAYALQSQRLLLVVHVMHGLGNRLRALAGALAFARNTNRILLLIWTRDAHCRALFTDLFVQPSHMIVLNTVAGLPRSHVMSTRWSQWIIRDELMGQRLPLNVNNVQHQHVYIRSAYALVTVPANVASWTDANRALRQLQPIASVQAKLHAVRVRAGISIGIHVRHASMHDDVKGVTASREYGAVEADVIAAWRAVANPRAFADEISHILKGNRTKFRGGVLVATDGATTRLEMRNSLSTTVGTWGVVDDKKMCYGREMECVQLALVELLVLAECPVVLGSMWSSFSEAVTRLSGRRVRLAGVDFAEIKVSDKPPTVKARIEEMLARRRRKRQRVRVGH